MVEQVDDIQYPGKITKKHIQAKTDQIYGVGGGGVNECRVGEPLQKILTG